MNIKYAAVQVLDVMSGIIDIVEANGCKDEEDIRPWLSERLAAYASQKAEIERLKAALDRQADNMAFVVNHVSLPHLWHEKFRLELEEDRAALSETSNGKD